MKIILVTEFFPSDIGDNFTGGVEARVFYLYQYLKRNNEVEVWSITNGYAFNSFNLFCKRIYYFIAQLLKIISYRGRADIIEGTNVTTYLLAYLLAKKTRANPVVWVPDLLRWSGVRHVNFLSGIAIALLEKLSVRLKWRGIIALSNETKRKLIKAGASENKIQVIYGGVDYNRYNAYHHYSKFKTPTIICVSRLVKYKRIQDLILAVYLLKQKVPDIKVLIVGDGPEKNNLKLKIENLKLRSNINLLGRITEDKKFELLSHSHLHILPSIVEGFGLVTIEALAAGTPVINADIAVNKEILLGETGGLLYRAGDYVDLADKIEMLLTDKKLYNQKVKEGKELVKQYEWEKVNQETERFYQRLLSN